MEGKREKNNKGEREYDIGSNNFLRNHFLFNSCSSEISEGNFFGKICLDI